MVEGAEVAMASGETWVRSRQSFSRSYVPNPSMIPKI